MKNAAPNIIFARLVRVPQGEIIGSTIRFIKLESTITDVIVRVQWLDKTKTSAIARPGQPWVKIVGQKTFWQVFSDYLVLGVDHFLSGFDRLNGVIKYLLMRLVALPPSG